MKVLITGAKGQLGTDMVLLLENDARFEVFPFSRTELDITNEQTVNAVINTLKPDVIIHTAAYTKVDLAESDIDGAYLVNAIGTRNIAVAAERVKAKLVYVSTDYVFDGEKGSSYIEFDPVNPLGVYGKSKYAGEEFVRSLTSRYFIVRTSWVYGKYGSNFVKTMLNLAQDHKELKVVDDQIGSPTYTVDLARFISELINTESYGIYHATNSGCCSWFEFAQAIFEEAGMEIKVNPCTTKDFPRPASRPAYSVLEHMVIRLNGMTDIRHWREALKDYFSK